MVSISVKTKYALVAMLDLALHYHGDSIQAKVLADRHSIPLSYLEQLLSDLKKKGVIHSFRGAQGGYVLAKPPEDITVFDIMTALENNERLATNHKGCEILEAFWKEMDAKIEATFSVTLQDLVKSKQRSEKMLTYSI